MEVNRNDKGNTINKYKNLIVYSMHVIFLEWSPMFEDSLIISMLSSRVNAQTFTKSFSILDNKTIISLFVLFNNNISFFKTFFNNNEFPMFVFHNFIIPSGILQGEHLLASS